MLPIIVLKLSIKHDTLKHQTTPSDTLHADVTHLVFGFWWESRFSRHKQQRFQSIPQSLLSVSKIDWSHRHVLLHKGPWN